ncbi:glycine N-acyltransferase-like protein 2 isoform X2 [Hyla sarda]|uniref:glycine N-acyltransferase-like protein 2 isoform X2 n=1 Tax=Hyla sarda TaxID=327740 RepID=UPI0024C3F393|nr:glycine N-acyltransferase-like protein 2 isoform X2 [Hyla sarda]
MTDRQLGAGPFLTLRMLLLTCSVKLAALRRLLTHSFPESLKVCGALQYALDKNPFGLQVVVDQWPDFTSVMCRPPLEEMTDPSDHYTNTYFLFSKDPQGLRHFLQDPQTVNWKQNLQIQGCQPMLTGVLQEVSSKHGSQMTTTSNLLYMRDAISSEDLEKMSKLSDLQFSTLKPEEAPLVNANWAFGGTPLGESYITRCIQNFPNVCIRRVNDGRPVAWIVGEQSSEQRMGFTEEPYRNKGLFRTMVIHIALKLHSLGCPLYCHVAPDNKKSQTATIASGFQLVGRWQQWRIQPS